MRYPIAIRAGDLLIETHREDMPLEALLDFASRQNPKRGFLFVSKVLGRHIPCRPSRMRQVYDQLAGRLQNLPGPVTVIGMAETATGLGAGVADSLARAGRQEAVLAMHTTRHCLAMSPLIAFDECHSHAPEHILYAPQDERAELFRRSRSLVLVDDEISTGRTLRLLAQRVAGHLPALKKIMLVAIVNWLGTAQRQAVAEGIPQDLGFASLLEGEFTFQPNPDYRPQLPAGMAARRPSRHARADTGRTGLLLSGAADWLPKGPLPAGPLVMVGTGEFAFFPFLAAEDLERRGHDVLFQSTTRSPILQGEAIQSKLTFTDEHGEGIANYIYNLPSDRQVIVAYEHPDLAAAHAFPRLVDAQVWTLP